MARMPRLVVPNYPHHVTQRGNRRQPTFFRPEDYSFYVFLLSEAMQEAGVDFWAYCLMPNHVHLVAVPEQEDSLANLFRSAHRQYSRHINRRENWQGHLWQERFHSFVMDDAHLISAVRYIELNPVRAKLCRDPEAWRWSSVHAHMAGTDDKLISVQPMLDRVGNWSEYLNCRDDNDKLDAIRSHSRTGRPAGSGRFVEELEQITGRQLRKRKPGRKANRGLRHRTVGQVQIK